MKKICLLIICLTILSGCSSKTEDFNKVCTQVAKSEDLTDTQKMSVDFNNKDEVTKAVVTRTYKAKGDNGNTAIKSIKKSSETFNNDLAKSEAIKIEISTDTSSKYVIKYYLDVQKLNDEQLEYFNLKKNSVKFFNKMRTEDIECK